MIFSLRVSTIRSVYLLISSTSSLTIPNSSSSCTSILLVMCSSTVSIISFILLKFYFIISSFYSRVGFSATFSDRKLAKAVPMAVLKRLPIAPVVFLLVLCCLDSTRDVTLKKSMVFYYFYQHSYNIFRIPKAPALRQNHPKIKSPFDIDS